MPAEKTTRAHGQAALAVGVFVALVATTLPVMRVIAPGAWVAAGFSLAAVILALGAVLRRVGVAGLAVTGIDIVVWVLALTLFYLRDSAWGGLVPSPATFDAVGTLISSAVQEMAVGAAPLAATPALSFFVVAAIGALAIVLDHVVITTRMPLLAAVALVAVAVVPTIAVPAPMDVFAFVLLAAGILFLLATDTRTRRGRTIAGLLVPAPRDRRPHPACLLRDPSRREEGDCGSLLDPGPHLLRRRRSRRPSSHDRQRSLLPLP